MSQVANKDNDDDWGLHEDVSDEEDTEDYDADHCRQVGNHYFGKGDFDSALRMYTMALELAQTERLEDSTLVTYLCNRSACLFRMEDFEASRDDAQEAVKLSEGKNVKAFFRLSRAQVMLKDFESALKNIDDALSTLPKEDSPDYNKDCEIQHKEFSKLKILARKKLIEKSQFPNADSLARIVSLKTEKRTPSIREFDIIKEIGEGNFSRVVICRHKITREEFALKIIEKKKADQLVVRQHPNVYNEIHMERRVLSGRIDGNPYIVKMYHAFQDYNSLYFLQQLFQDRGDMWSTMRYEKKMVGSHPSLVKMWLWELLDALEHCHSRGIVHRDLKPENIILNPKGHVILLDFGTAKDLIQTDLNGPEFVGTPDFMAYESIRGNSGRKSDEEEKKSYVSESDHTLDLWTFGAVAFNLLTGSTPFASPSPFLTFLKIERGLLFRPWGIADDNAWDLITKLIQLDPRKRIGADCFQYQKSLNKEEPHKIIQHGDGYDVIRDHPYFDNVKEKLNESKRIDETLNLIPSLEDLCIRTCTELLRKDSLNLDLDTEHPPGNGDSHDFLRLNNTNRKRVMHVLDKLRIVSQPRIYRRFFKTKQEARLNKIRVDTRDFVGLTAITDKQHQFPYQDERHDSLVEEYSTVANTGPFQFLEICNPLFVKKINENCSDEERKGFILKLKETLRLVNRTRPKLVVACGHIDGECRKWLGKVNETIPVVIHDGSIYYSFWICGAQGLMLQSKGFPKDENKSNVKDEDQFPWLHQQLQQCRVAKHIAFAFIDCCLNEVPKYVVRFLARNRISCFFTQNEACISKTSNYHYVPLTVYRNLPDGKKEADILENDIENDDLSVSSCESETDENIHDMKIISHGDSSTRCITLVDNATWELELL